MYNKLGKVFFIKKFNALGQQKLYYQNKMQQEFTELFKNLRDLTMSFTQVQANTFEFLEEEDVEESKFYKELRKKIETLKIHENAIQKVRKTIDEKINEHYKDSDAKYKSV
jgi:archaellum component FlaC